jgi:hypothetical protein
MEKSKGGTFPLRLEILQKRRDFHFSHRPGYNELTSRLTPTREIAEFQQAGLVCCLSGKKPSSREISYSTAG